uniref:Reverse transcriptase domain-containing protein n=1 Tax=Tanacetum cinerariifolium TaxID=118510 RepID=A0A6L2NBH0_TANCI|nr:reverse transcriptase domain-containing protein [Tanacetum cinerariifolium]
MIKEHDQQAKAKTTPRKLVYDEFKEENLDNSRTKDLSERLSNESSGTSRTRDKARSVGKIQRSLCRSRTSSHLRIPKRLESRSKSKAKLKGERARSRGKRSRRRKVSTDSEGEGEANRRGCGIRKTGLVGKGYTPRQPEKQNSRTRRQESHKHGTIEGYHVQRIYVDDGSSLKIMYEHYFKSFSVDIKSRSRKSNAPLVGFSGETYHPLGLIDLKNEKPWSSGFHHPFDDQVPNSQGSRYEENQQGSLVAMQTDRDNAKFVKGDAMVSTYGTNVQIREQAILRARSIPTQRHRNEPMVTEET